MGNISTVRSPQQIVGSLIRNWVAETCGYNPAEIYSVSIMPCTAKKYEAQREEMTRKGLPDIDAVLTTRELVRLIRLNGIDMNHLDPEPADEPMGAMSSAGKLFGTGGGPMEALLRTIYYKLTGEEMAVPRINKLRVSRTFKEMNLKVGKRELSVVAVSGMAEAAKLIADLRAGRRNPDIIEIMACPHGCVNGGGQPVRQEEEAIRNRIKILYEADNKEMIKVAHRNPQVLRVYEELLETPGSSKSMELLHLSYRQKEAIELRKNAHHEWQGKSRLYH